MKHNFVVLSSDNCQPCLALKRYLADIGLSWDIKYRDSRFHPNDPTLFDALSITSVPTFVEEVRPNEYKIRAIGYPDCQKFARQIKFLSTPIPELGDEEE